MSRPSSGPLVAAGLLLGAGMGGFVDGIVFHQMLQTHNMLSARLPPNTLIDAKVNMFWDGVFHAAVWFMTLAGVVMLFRAGRDRRAPWSGRALAGGGLLGWGSFNLIEGVIDHEILGLHHVMEYAADHRPADLAFLAAGVLLCALGGWLVKRGVAGFDARPSEA
jgi:uncharacterized membrane protein